MSLILVSDNTSLVEWIEKLSPLFNFLELVLFLPYLFGITPQWSHTGLKFSSWKGFSYKFNLKNRYRVIQIIYSWWGLCLLCFLCLSLESSLDLWIYNYYQIWKLSAIISSNIFAVSSFLSSSPRTPITHILGCLKLSHSSLLFFPFLHIPFPLFFILHSFCCYVFKFTNILFYSVIPNLLLIPSRVVVVLISDIVFFFFFLQKMTYFYI